MKNTSTKSSAAWSYPWRDENTLSERKIQFGCLTKKEKKIFSISNPGKNLPKPGKNSSGGNYQAVVFQAEAIKEKNNIKQSIKGRKGK